MPDSSANCPIEFRVLFSQVEWAQPPYGFMSQRRDDEVADFFCSVAHFSRRLAFHFCAGYLVDGFVESLGGFGLAGEF